MLKKGLYLFCASSILSASSTMCFINNHMNPSTVESIALQGGECNNKLSVIDMKKNGFIVEDIKIKSNEKGFDYIYIFKKSRNSLSKISTNDNKVSDIELGKKLYNKECRKCHKDGSVSAYNVARPLNTLDEEDIKQSIAEYSLGERDAGMAILMKPYADTLSSHEIKNVAKYIQTLK